MSMPHAGCVSPARPASPLKSMCAKIIMPFSRAIDSTLARTSGTLRWVGRTFRPSTEISALIARAVRSAAADRGQFVEREADALGAGRTFAGRIFFRTIAISLGQGLERIPAVNVQRGRNRVLGAFHRAIDRLGFLRILQLPQLIQR